MLSRNEIKALARLQQKKFRVEEQRFLIEGPRLILECLRSDWPLEKLLVTAAFRERPLAQALLSRARERQVPVFEISRLDLDRLCETAHSQGIVGVVRMKVPEVDPVSLFTSLPRCLFVAIERLQDPGNLGTIIRTAEWLGAHAVVVGPECVEWSNPKTLRASVGAVFHLPVYEIETFVDFLQEVRKFGASVYAADQRGEFPYTTLRYGPKKVLLLGEEAHGLSEDCRRLADYTVTIPRRGKIESLNVAIAAAILMADMMRS